MAAQTSDLRHANLGMAALVACVVQTLNETDPTFQERFLTRVGKSYYEFLSDTGDATQELELLAWTRELLTGKSVSC